MAEAKPKTLADLRKKFEGKTVGLLPKPYKKDSPKGKCDVCNGYHGLPAVHLDYVGHAAVTDRLLEVDPQWSWEPLALDESGLPKTDRAGNLWIKLTVLGVTRIGVGDGSNAKECIGDAIRNAAMRFGVALDLWSKEELESALVDPSMVNDKPSAAIPPEMQQPPAVEPVSVAPVELPAVRLATEDQLIQVTKTALAKGKTEAWIGSVIKKLRSSTPEVARGVIQSLSELEDRQDLPPQTVLPLATRDDVKAAVQAVEAEVDAEMSAADNVLSVMTEDESPTANQIAHYKELRLQLGYREGSTTARLNMIKSAGEMGMAITKMKQEISDLEPES